MYIILSVAQIIKLFHFIREVTGGLLNLEEEGISDSRWVKVSDLVKFDDKDFREVY